MFCLPLRQHRPLQQYQQQHISNNIAKASISSEATTLKIKTTTMTTNNLKQFFV